MYNLHKMRNYTIVDSVYTLCVMYTCVSIVLYYYNSVVIYKSVNIMT